MKNLLLHALKTTYIHWPAALIDDARMIGAFAATALAFYVLCVPGRRLSPRAALAYVFPRAMFGARTAWVDIAHFILALGLWIPAIGALVTVWLTIDMRDLLAARLGVHPPLLAAGWMLGLLQFAVIFVARDFGTYVGHILLHKVPLLWSIHRTHHSAESLTFFTSARAHPLEYLHAQGFMAIFGALGGGAFLYLTGTSLQPAPVAVLMAVSLFLEIFGLAQHSHVPISFGRFDRILLAPVLHQLHHSAEPRHRDKNLGGNLSVFDWLFGTLYLPQPHEAYRWGLNEDELGDNNPHLRLRDFYFEPARHAWRLLTGGARRAGETGPDSGSESGSQEPAPAAR